jgi:hypothetical protein
VLDTYSKKQVGAIAVLQPGTYMVVAEGNIEDLGGRASADCRPAGCFPRQAWSPRRPTKTPGLNAAVGPLIEID